MVKILLEKIFKNENNKLVVKLKFEVNNYKTKIEKKKKLLLSMKQEKLKLIREFICLFQSQVP